VSVHIASFPETNPQYIDKKLEERMELAQSISSMVLALRKKVNIKVRQPLSAMLLPTKDSIIREHIESIQSLILNETNVKELRFVDNTAGILIKRVKPDFKKLGPQFGKIMKQVSNAIASMNQESIAQLEQNGAFSFVIEGQQVSIAATDVEIISEDIPGWLVANEGNLTVALDITLTESLLQEGIARELVNRIQNLRKANGYEITDRISIRILRSEQIEAAVKTYTDYIASQTLANSITFVSQMENATEFDFEVFTVFVQIEKA
jgi:isoleucyl-tRNA synthetase